MVFQQNSALFAVGRRSQFGRRTGTLLLPFLFAGLALSMPGVAPADWLANHRDDTNNGFVDVPSAVVDLSGTPAETMGGNDIVPGIRSLVFDDHLYAVAEDGGTFDVFILRLRMSDGIVVGQSPALAARVFGSVGAPAIDDAARDLYYATGHTMYRLDADTLAVDWSSDIDSTTTAASGVGYDIVNPGAVLGGGRVYINTFDPIFDGSQSQLVAFDAATGAIDWFTTVGSFGGASPIYVDLGAQQLVVTGTSAGGGSASSSDVAAYDAATGALVWHSASIAVPWTAQRHFWTEFVYHGGSLYGATLDFGAANTELAKFDPATGALDYIVPALSTDSPPVIIGSNLYLYGGGFGASEIAAYSLADGMELFSASIGASAFRNYMAATQDSIYFTAGGQLLRIDPANGSVLSQTPGMNFAGPVTLDDAGRVFTQTASAGELAGFGMSILTSVESWTTYD